MSYRNGLITRVFSWLSFDERVGRRSLYFSSAKFNGYLMSDGHRDLNYNLNLWPVAFGLLM